MKREEIDFMKLYVALLYQYGYCYYDVSKEYLENYLHELRKIMEAKKMFKKYNNLEGIFEYNQKLQNYDNFINLILYVTSGYSFIDKNANIIMLNLNKKLIYKILKEDNYINLENVDDIVNYMVNYINKNIKIKVIVKNNKN